MTTSWSKEVIPSISYRHVECSINIDCHDIWQIFSFLKMTINCSKYFLPWQYRLQHNYRTIWKKNVQKGHLSDSLIFRKEWGKAAYHTKEIWREVLGAKEELKSSKVRDSGEYDRKSFRITTPILSRNCRIIAEEILTVFHFPLQH